MVQLRWRVWLLGDGYLHRLNTTLPYVWPSMHMPWPFSTLLKDKNNFLTTPDLFKGHCDIRCSVTIRNDQIGGSKLDKYWKKNVLLNKTVANNLSLCVNNDGSNAKKGVSKSSVPTTHGFGATSFALKAQRCHRFSGKTMCNNSEIHFCRYNRWELVIAWWPSYLSVPLGVAAKVYFWVIAHGFSGKTVTALGL